jgi:hypothetical protein
MFLGMRLECRIRRKMISTQTERGHVAIDQFRHGLLYRSDHILRSPGERRDITVISSEIGP